MISTIAVLSNNEIATSGFDDNTIKIWDLNKSACIATFTGHSGNFSNFIYLLPVQIKEKLIDKILPLLLK